MHKYLKPPVRFNDEMFEGLQCNGGFPELFYTDTSNGEAVDPTTLSEEQQGDADIVNIIGCFVHVNDIVNPGPSDITILFSDFSCYTPVGQHSTFHDDYMEECYWISLEDYKAIAGYIYTPEDYLKALEVLDPHTRVLKWAEKDNDFIYRTVVVNDDVISGGIIPPFIEHAGFKVIPHVRMTQYGVQVSWSTETKDYAEFVFGMTEPQYLDWVNTRDKVSSDINHFIEMNRAEF